MNVPFCTFCLEDDDMHNEATWVIEVVSPDSLTVQRVLACWKHLRRCVTDEHYHDPQFEEGNYTAYRRYLPSDAILTFDALVAGDEE